MAIAAPSAPAPSRASVDSGPWVQLKEVAGDVVVDLATCVSHAETYYLVEVGHDGTCYLPSTEGLPKRHYRIIPGARYILARKSETNMRRNLPKRTLCDTAIVAAQLKKQRTSSLVESTTATVTSTVGSSCPAPLGGDSRSQRKRLDDETAPTLFPRQLQPKQVVVGKAPALPEDLDDRPITLAPARSAPPASAATRTVLGAAPDAVVVEHNGAAAQNGWGVSRSPSAFAAPAMSTSAAAFGRAEPSESAAGVHRRRSYVGESISAVNVHNTQSPSPNPFRVSEPPIAAAEAIRSRETEDANEPRRERKKRRRGGGEKHAGSGTAEPAETTAAELNDDGLISETQLTQRTLSADTLSPLFAPSQPFPSSRRSGSLAAAAQSASRSMHARRV